MGLACVLAVCAIGVVCGSETAGLTVTDNRHQRSLGRQLFLSIAAGGEGGGDGVTLPTLVSVPVHTNKSANPDSRRPNHEVPAKLSGLSQTPEAPLSNVPYLQIRDLAQIQSKINSYPQPNSLQGTKSKSVILMPQEPIQKVKRLQESAQVVIELNGGDPENPSDVKRLRTSKSSLLFQRTFVPAAVFNIYAPNGNVYLYVGDGSKNVSFNLETQEDGGSGKEPDASVSVDLGDEKIEKELKVAVTEDETNPFSYRTPMFDTSEQIIQSFLSQSPVDSGLPAVISDLHLPDRLPYKPTPVGSPPIPARIPPRPDFNRSLHLRVDLTVPGFTEAYDIQWHAESNTARSVIEGGSTIIYRAPVDHGRIQFLEIRLERADGQKFRHCTLSPLVPGSRADKSFPGLPALDHFEFKDYTSAEGRSLVERWRHVMTSGAGEGGAAAGESLTFTHEMLIVREWGQAVPLRYTVVTDSSVLGPASDSYTHRYKQLAEPTAAVIPDVSRECDIFDEVDDHEHHDHEGQRLQRDTGDQLSRVVSRFDPIREFAGPTRNTRYDSILTKFKKQYKRKYLDPAEEAVRKNLLVKSTRFIEAGNRLASGFKMASNFMSDRLDDEINQLLGSQIQPEGGREPGLVPFPYSANELKKISNELGDEFDWRPLGAVSPVRFQETTCSSCWAFAVAGSTEGALFKKTNKLVPLSPQCLVDCGKPFGTNGCNGTWPSFAYDYVQARGLPAWDEYTDYQAKVLECRDQSVPPVTHISGHVKVTPFSEAALKVAIKHHAPSVVVVDAKATSFIYYKSGVLKDKRCGQNKPRLNHAVLAVGWGTKDGPHFIIKNTWSATWGEEGYIRIAPDSCAVLEQPSYAVIEEPNIDRKELRA